MRLVMLGPPGVGKGTQTKLLTKHFGMPHISTGDILRFNVTAGSELGIKAQSYMESGGLVPDELVIDMVNKRLIAADCADGFLIDGYPRTAPQAEALQRFLDEHRLRLDRVINLHLPAEEIIRRMSGRRLCTGCGAIFHQEFAPSTTVDTCDICGTVLTQRQDDRPEAIAHRIQVYERNARALLNYYEHQGILVTIAAEGDIGSIQQRILERLL